MSDALTGRAAVEAIQFFMGAGNTNARFDARKVTAALRTRLGRSSLARAFTIVRRPLWTPRRSLSAPRSRPRRGRARFVPGRPAGGP